MPQKKAKPDKRSATRSPATPSRQASLIPPLRHTITTTPAESWPILECLIAERWREPGELIQILVVREEPQTGTVMAAVFLLDLGCLGVKDAYSRRFSSVETYATTLRERVMAIQPLIEVDLDTVARVIRDGIAYADSLGLKPHRDFAGAAIYLAGSNPDAADIDVPLGQDGKPFFINGPNDDVPKILAQLDRAVGPGNYHYLIGGPPPGWME